MIRIWITLAMFKPAELNDWGATLLNAMEGDLGRSHTPI
jgi:hypothetical protein